MPEVTHRRNYTTVKYSFGPFNDVVELRIRATYAEWKWLWENLKFDAVCFSDIKPFIDKRTSPKKAALLESYATDQNEHFCFDVLSIVQCGIVRSPKIFKKPRGGDPYGRSRGEMLHIRNCCRTLYRYLRFWFKQPKHIWPDYLKELLKHNDAEHITSALEAVKYIANRRFNHMPQETKHFERSFLTNRGKLLCKFKPPTKPLHGVRPLLDEFLK